ncbi:MAG: YqgE/AlgH family protein [Bacteroidales bacterium]|nr:YqgE/AlgH family protein [Lentimicrobiaceae bacterium]MDD5693880.1 YqgE/AlgH family protein [Bacteroidales bacterium]
MKPAPGRLLISEPSLTDFYFKQSVILLAEHNDQGSFGLIINKPIQARLNEVTKDFPEFDAEMFLGGPVKTENIFYLHTVGEFVQNSIKIMDGLYWGGDIEMIKEMMILHQLTSKNIRFFIGYSGWGSRQLERELKEKSWVISPAKADQVIHDNPRKMWGNLMRSIGDEYALWANYPPDPSLN